MRSLLIFLPFYLLGICTAYSQSIISVTPSNASLGSTSLVNMTGQNTNFGQGTSTTSVWFSQGTSTILVPGLTQVIDKNNVAAEFTFCYSEPMGFYDVHVYNDIDGWMTKFAGFRLDSAVNPPQIVMVNPDSAYPGETLSVAVTGQSSNFNQATQTTVWLSQGTSTILMDSVNVKSSLKLVADFSIPDTLSPGLWDVNVLSDFCMGIITLEQGFEIHCNHLQPLINTLFDTVYSDSSALVQFNDGSQFASSWYWDFGDGAFDSLQNPAHLYNSSGTYLITFAVNYNNCFDTTYRTITVLDPADTLVSISKSLNTLSSINIFPNPASSELFVNSPDNIQEITIMDMVGKIVYTNTPESREIHLKIDELTIPGIYVISVKTALSTKLEKLIVH